jgi:hypothetical protein
VHYPVLVRATGGVYDEEATGTRTALQGDLEAVFTAAPARMIVSVYSNAIVQAARAAGGLTSANLAAAMVQVNAFAGGFDVQQTAPAFVTPGTALAAADLSDGAKWRWRSAPNRRAAPTPAHRFRTARKTSPRNRPTATRWPSAIPAPAIPRPTGRSLRRPAEIAR